MTDKMGTIIEEYCSSVWRGLLALVLAPSLLALPVLATLLLIFNLGSRDDRAIMGIREQMRDIGIVLIALIQGTIIFGLPTWILLRAFRHESSMTYGLAGLGEGLFAAFYIGYSGSGPLRLDQTIGFGLLSLAGGAIALTFWRIARVRTYCGSNTFSPRSVKNTENSAG